MSSTKFIARNGLAVGTSPVDVVDSTGTLLINAPTVTNGVYTTDTGTVTNTMLAGSIANAKLANSSTTIGTTSIALGASSTTLGGLTSVTSTSFTGAVVGNASTATTLATARAIQGVSFDGSAAITVVTAGTGVSVSGTAVAIGQAVGTTDNVTFNSVTVNGTLTSDDITSTNISVAGNATITGNLTVSGTTTTINSTTIAIADLNLELASNATTAAAANGAGITITGPVTPATLTYTSADDRWNLNKNLNVSTVFGALSGNASTATTLQTTRAIQGVDFDGSAAITVVTAGTGISVSGTAVTNTGILSIAGTAPVSASTVSGATTISMAAATASVNGYMTSTYAAKLDGIAAGATNVTNNNQLTNGAGYVTSSGVTSVSGTAPVVSSGGTTPAISMAAASSGVNGYMTGTYATKLDGIATGATNVTNTNQLTNGAGYITGYTEVDTLATVTGRGASTSSAVSLSGSVFAPVLYLSSHGDLNHVLKKNSDTFNGKSNGQQMRFYNYQNFYSSETSTSVLHLDSNSYVGMGTTSPLSKLHMTGSNSYAGAGLLLGSAGVASGYIWTTDNLYIKPNTTANTASGGVYIQDFAGNTQFSFQSYDGVGLASASWRAPIFYDSNNTGYYLDPASTSNLNALTVNAELVAPRHYVNRAAGANSGINWYSSSFTSWTDYMSPPGTAGCGPTGNITAPSGALATSWSLRRFIENTANYGWTWESGTSTGQPSVVAEIRSSDGMAQFNGGVRSPIFYDSNNTAYYLDPASASVVSDMRINDGNVQIRAGNVNRNTKWRALDASTDVGISFYNSADTWCMQLYANAGSEYGFLNGNWAAWDFRKVPSGNLFLNNQSTYYINGSEAYMNRVYGVTDIRSPLFYDNDDTSYYANPNSFSQFSSLSCNGDFRTTFVSGAGGSTFSSNHYSMGKDIANGSWSNPHYSDLIIGYHTGIRIGGHYSGTRFYSNSPTTDANNDGNGDGGEALLMTVGGYVGTANHTDVYVNNNLFAGASMRSPIFYDSNDTSYYTNPNSFSQMSYGNFNAAPGGRTLSLGGDQTDRVYNDAARASLVINATYYPHLYINATTNNSNEQHGAVLSMTGNLSAGGYRRWGMGIANTNPDCFSWGYADNNTNPHYGVGGTFGYTGTPNIRMWLNTGGALMTSGDMRSPIFYDSEDTTYFSNPNSSGVSLRIAGAIQSNHTAWTGEMNKIQWHSSHLYFQNTSDGNFTFRQANGNEPFTLTIGGAYGTAQGSWRAPIFYDSNDTSYYLDAASTSRINRIDYTNLYYAPDTRFGFVGANVYADTINSGVAGDQLELCYYTGSFTSSAGSMRAPLFYDRDDTGYYTDPASGTQLKYVNVKGAWGGSPFGSSHAQLNIEGDAYPSITHRNMSTGGYWLVHHAADDTMNWYGGTGGYNGTAWNRNMYLDMAGNLTARGSVTAYSDRNLKTNIVTIDNALDKVLSLRGVYFDWIESGVHSIGMIAQEVEEILPELVITTDEREVGTETTKNIIKSLDYSKIVSVLVEAIKEQQKQIEELKAEMQVMKNNSIT